MISQDPTLPGWEIETIPDPRRNEGPCARCKTQGQPEWASSPIQCAFPHGVFQTENWCCATMAALRKLATDESGMPLNGQYCDDQSVATLAIPPSENDTGHFLVLGWYKQRGRTENAVVLKDTSTILLSIETAEWILGHTPWTALQEARQKAGM